METFRREYAGKIWLEVFILKGVNDGDADIEALRLALQRIRPDKVQLNTLDRPPAYPGVESADFAHLERIRDRWPRPAGGDHQARRPPRGDRRPSAPTWRTAC